VKRKERMVMGKKKLACFREIGNNGIDDDMFVDLTIYDIPAGLLREFGEKVVHSSYPSGVNEAIKDLLRKAIMEQDSRHNNVHVLAT
jgi:hypothetical protein